MLNSIEAVDQFKTNFLKVVMETINAVNQLILQDHHVTDRQIERTISSSALIQSIFHEYVSVKKVCSLWIPHNLSNAHKRLERKASKIR